MIYTPIFYTNVNTRWCNLLKHLYVASFFMNIFIRCLSTIITLFAIQVKIVFTPYSFLVFRNSTNNAWGSGYNSKYLNHGTKSPNLNCFSKWHYWLHIVQFHYSIIVISFTCNISPCSFSRSNIILVNIHTRSTRMWSPLMTSNT